MRLETRFNGIEADQYLRSCAIRDASARGIQRAEVERVIRGPEQVLPSRKGREIYQSRIGARGRLLLRGVVKEVSTAYHVVTAYKTSKIAKYWKQS